VIEQIPVEFITMSAAGIGGFLMKAKALDNERRHAQQMQAIDALKARLSLGMESANAAGSRIGDSFGRWTRRTIAWALVLGVLLLCFFPGFFGAPAIVQTVKESSGFLFGLFPGGTKTEFHELNGFIHSPAVLLGFGHIIAFYFGQAAAKP
jgi:hypothetical protein